MVIIISEVKHGNQKNIMQFYKYYYSTTAMRVPIRYNKATTA